MIEPCHHHTPGQGRPWSVLGGSLPPSSYPSGFALPTDRNSSFRHDHRYFAFTLRIVKHRFQFLGGRKNVDVIKILVFFFVSFPSFRGERSCVFTKNQYLVCHLFPPKPKTPRRVHASKKSLPVTHSETLNREDLTTFSIGVNDLELTTPYRAGSYI